MDINGCEAGIGDKSLCQRGMESGSLITWPDQLERELPGRVP